MMNTREIEETFKEDNIAFVVEFEGQNIPFYQFITDEGVVDDKFIAHLSRSDIEDYLDFSDDRPSRRLMKLINNKLTREGDDYHYGLCSSFYSSYFIIKKSKNMCQNCAYTYAFGTDWDIRCEKGGFENRNDNFIGKYNKKCCDNYSYTKC